MNAMSEGGNPAIETETLRAARLLRFLRPRTIAVVGGKEAARVADQCDRTGFKGPIYPVHPTRSEIAGRPCFRRIEDLPEVPDAVFLAIPPEPSIAAVALLSSMGAGGAVVYAAGFAEAGEAGGIKQERLVEAAGNMPILGPNCYGMLNYMEGAALWPDVHGGVRADNGVAIILQSGNMAINLTMQDRGLPIAYVMSTGNQAALGTPELLEAVVDDPRVTAIGLHIEGIGDVSAFSKSAVKAWKAGKPIVALQSGRSDAGARLAISHTSSMAGGRAASEALLRRFGIARVETPDDLIETLKLLHVAGPIDGPRLVSMSCSGGEAALMADLAEERGLRFPAFGADRIAKLAGILGLSVTIDNPLDYHTYIWEDEAAMTACFSAALGSDADAGILILDYPKPGSGDEVGWKVAEDALIASAKGCGKPVILCATLPENLPDATKARMMAEGIVPAQGMGTMLNAVRAAYDIGLRRAGRPPEPLAEWPVLNGMPSTLDEWRSKRWLSSFGIPVPDGALVNSPEEGLAFADTIGYPVVAKAVSATLVHKTEAGAVRLNLTDADSLYPAVEDLLNISTQILVERMMQDYVCEMIAGIVRDPALGPILMIGSGGIYAELLDDRVVLPLPATRTDMEEAVNELKMAPLLAGYRGRPPGDREALLNTLCKVADFAVAHAHELAEMDINPILVGAEGTGVFAADAFIRVYRNGLREEAE